MHSTGSFVLRDPEHEALFFIEKVLHTKNREALGVSGFTILSVKHCFYIFSTQKVPLTKNRVGRNVQQIWSCVCTPNQSVVKL